MPAELYLNKIYFDRQRNKYRPTTIIDIRPNRIEMLTEDGKILVLFHDLENPQMYQTRMNWICNIENANKINEVTLFPVSFLAGLKRTELGYILAPSYVSTLDYYIRPGKGEKLFKWYFNKTGGISYRLRISYKLAAALQQIHSQGYCLVDICPNHIHLQEYDLNNSTPSIIQFSGIDQISSYTIPPVTAGAATYSDPLVYLNRTSASTSSDTYSFAIVLFELLTTCHPFIGADVEELSGELLSSAIDSGKLDYIGDCNSQNNKNDDFKDIQTLLPQDLECLFKQMFIEGKFNAAARPTLDDFKIAIIQSLKKIIKCDHRGCEKEYPYNKEHICPFCDNQTDRVIIARVKKRISASGKILFPNNGTHYYPSLPAIEEEINYMVIRGGETSITPICFDPKLKPSSFRSGIRIHYTPEENRLGIRNCFKKFNIKVNGQILTPYSKNNQKNNSDIWLSSLSKITIELLPDNAQLEPETIVPIHSDVYGSVTFTWIITIN